MKFERAAWLTIVILLSTVLFRAYDQNYKLQDTFLVGADQATLVARSRPLLVKNQGMKNDDVERYFYISYAYFSKETCIRFVPKPGITGGSTSYCYGISSPFPLLRTDFTS